MSEHQTDAWGVFPNALRRRIAIDPDVLGGEPRIRDTRIAVAHVIGAAVAGGQEEVFRQFPQLKPEDLAAAWAFTQTLLERPGIGADLLWSFSSMPT